MVSARGAALDSLLQTVNSGHMDIDITPVGRRPHPRAQGLVQQRHDRQRDHQRARHGDRAADRRDRDRADQRRDPELNPTTTYGAETSPNTSAASNFASIWPFANGDAVGNVSKVATRELLYCGATTATYAHLQGWFGEASHKSVGYDSKDPAQVTRQVTEMIARGISGAIVDWYGPGDQSNTVTQLLLGNAGNLGGSAARSYDLTKLNLAPGTYQLYVEAVGQPSMFNHITGPFTYVR